MRDPSPLIWLNIILIGVLLPALHSCMEPLSSHPVVHGEGEFTESILFPRAEQRKTGNSKTATEFRVWAQNRNLILMEDCQNGDLKNDEAEIITPTGLNFDLRVAQGRRAFVYLDIVSFRPMSHYKPHIDNFPCAIGEPQIKYRNVPQALNRKVYWLEVIVNGKVLKTLYTGGGVFIDSPIKVVVERELTRYRRLDIRLLPSPGAGVFAIWDARVRTRDESSRLNHPGL